MRNSLFENQIGKSNVTFVIVAALAIAIGLAFQVIKRQPVALPDFEKLAILPQPKSLGEVKFTDHNGDAFTAQNLQGKWTILFFAFTNCPDICPSTLHTLKQVKKTLEDQGLWSQFQVAMVTVDPARDTTERLKSYVPFFDPAFIGLRAELDYTTEFAKNVGILFFKSKEFENGGYDVDHGAALIFVNPEGQYAGAFNAPHPQELLTRDLIKLGKFAAKRAQTSQRERPQANKRVASAPTFSDGQLITEKAWIRAAPEGSMSMAGYFVLSNQGTQAVRVVGASSPLFDDVMIHETSMHDGMMSMDHVAGVDLAAGAQVEFKPMGMHLMMMRPKTVIALGTPVPVQLTLANGELIDVQLTVLNEAPQ